MENLKNNEKEVLEKLNRLDMDTLNFIEKYSKAYQKNQRVQTLISTTIASVAGAAITAAYFFPQIDKSLVALGALTFGVTLSVFALKERQKEHSILVRKIINSEINTLNINKINVTDEKKKIIEKILSGGSF